MREPIKRPIKAKTHSSLFEIAPVETTPFSKSEPPPPQHNEPEEHNKNKLSYSSKSLDSSFKRNKGSTDRGILHSQDQNTNSYQVPTHFSDSTY